MEELFDILDENGKPTGKTKPRSQVHRDGDWHGGVHIWIVKPNGDVLIQKRSLSKDTHPGYWAISCAGHISAGSNSIETAIKEVKEELGFGLTENDFNFMFKNKFEKIDPDGAFIDREFNDVYLVEKDIDADNLFIDKNELSEVKLIHYAKLRDLIENKKIQFTPNKKEQTKIFKILAQKFGKV